MPGKRFQWSLRLRVLAPTVAILCIAISGLIFTVVQVQTRFISDTVLSVNGTLEMAHKETQKQFKTMSGGINRQLKVMAEQAGGSLATAMGYALDREKEAYVEETDAHLRESAESLAHVLSKVAPSAVFLEDFPTLLSYSRAADECPNVLYALFLNNEGRPLVHHLKTDDPIIKKFLQGGEGEDEIAKVIHASRQDQSVLVVEKNMEKEGVKLGTVLLCVDMAPAKEKAEEMSARFATLVLENRQMVDSVLEMETSDVAGKLDGMLQTLGAKSKAFANTVEQAISRSFKGMSEETGRLVAGLGGASIVLVVLALFFVVSRVTRAILRLSSILHEGSENVVAGSTQVAAASQSLAEGASEQAASIEETSSSLEEMSSMTRKNAENASQADNLMKEANEVVTRANESMGQLTVSMKEISGASRETSKIIRTIDEIAFQTNLLALNAAVEAARAGEAGAGFAVVAGEVRNLAMRAAEAARNTAALIEGTVKKVKEGTDLVSRTNEAFGEVAVSAAKVGELVAEIAAASNEQAQGIEQVNTAVAEMDKVVQQNAASAEESASASEEMNAQAEQMKGIVGDLVALVGGRRKTEESRQYAVASGKKEEGKKAFLPAAGVERGRGPMPQRAKPELSAGREVTPEQVIPLNDGEFQDF